MYYLSNFILYSVLGYIFEIIISLIFHLSIESGFMYGPYTPIYGLGIILTFTMFNKFKKITPEIKKVLIMFISSLIVLTILELTGGLLLKNLYNITMWSYKKLPLHIGKYISLEISLAWSIISILIYFYLKPITDKLIKKIPNYIIIGISLIMVLDFIITNIILIF